MCNFEGKHSECPQNFLINYQLGMHRNIMNMRAKVFSERKHILVMRSKLLENEVMRMDEVASSDFAQHCRTFPRAPHLKPMLDK